MALHHWPAEVKAPLYRRIHDALRPGGLLVNGDYILANGEQDPLPTFPGAEAEENSDLLHIDIPLRIDVEEHLLAEAGFASVRTLFRTPHAAVFVAERSPD